MTTLDDILAKSRTKRNPIEDVIADAWNTYRYSKDEEIKAFALKKATDATALYNRLVAKIIDLELEIAALREGAG